jgi:hypothetical protein
MEKQKRKFSKEYKELVKTVFLKEGLEGAYQFVKKDFPQTTNRTIRSWVDVSFQKNIQQIRKKSHEKAKKNCPEKLKKWSNTSYQNEKEKRKNDPQLKKERVQLSRNWANKNRPRIRELDRKYWHEGTKKQKRYEYIKNRKENDLEFHIKENARSRAHGLLKNALTDKIIKHCTTVDFFGCTPKFLTEHLRSQYKPGMTDKNYGKEWHLDHIKPCSLFDLTDKKQFLQCWHYTNLQPLWAAENLAKSNKYEEPNQ